MNTESTIVSTPLDLPHLEPDNWDRWWDIWNEFSRPLAKTGVSPNSESGLHVGFDVFKIPQFNPVYKADYVDLKSLYPDLYNQILSLPVTIYGARFVSSRGDFSAHIDNKWHSWSIRNMFYCPDAEPQWYYTDREGNNKKYLIMPETTNWWAYLDGAIKHGTHYKPEFPKIILQVFSDIPRSAELSKRSFSKFPNHIISYDINC